MKIYKSIQISIIKPAFLLIFIFSFDLNAAVINPPFPRESKVILESDQANDTSLIEKLSNSINVLYLANDTAGFVSFARSVEQLIQKQYSENRFHSDLLYLAGVGYLLGSCHSRALLPLKKSVEMREKLNIKDERYAKGIYNIGIAYNFLGDCNEAGQYFSDYIKLAIKIHGEGSPETMSAYSPLLGAAIDCNDYESFINNTINALDILSKNPGVLNDDVLCDLYHTIGIGYMNLEDYAKAKVYLEQSVGHLDRSKNIPVINYINLINSLAIVNGNLGFDEKAAEYFEKVIDLSISNNSFLAFNLLNTYAIELGNSGQVAKGEDLLYNSVSKAEKVYGVDSRYYIEVLEHYAEYLREFKNDFTNSLPLFMICVSYLNNHREDQRLRENVIRSYALALSKSGEPVKALREIQALLFGIKNPEGIENIYLNPEIGSLKADRTIVRLIQSKHEILWDIYRTSGSIEVLEAAAGTSELLILLVDKLRLSISEEESRIVLGDRYRDFYLSAIHNFDLCFRKTGEHRFLEKAFEFSERCKVAGLLAATRELNATQFNIPQDIAKVEKQIQRDISSLNSRISIENEKPDPDRTLLADMNEDLLKKIILRDSLVLSFEKDFPGYYTLKYSMTAPELKNIPSITGRNTNYVNYVMSDSLLYIFLVNRRHQKLITQRIDSTFLGKLTAFRELLANPMGKVNARADFNDYQKISLSLSRILVDPLKQYLISDNLLISPDNLISYIPFETLLSSEYPGNSILYRKLDYLMNEYNISYTYSATFMGEAVNRKTDPKKNLIAFAPIYTRNINLDSLFANRQADNRNLYDLPFSREEATYVASIKKGNLFINNEARESVFKNIAGDYGIIHLAMHTVLNDQNPMNSAMIFAGENDAPEDGLLHTFEVYGIPISARMVVLSSCNTGSGILSTGEGILSLARGFLYSGSQSVVMSMWEIDDRSGTQIVKMFYDNLAKGSTKSMALKRARTEYLKNASQLHSHPYFWSALVIYGDNEPVYKPLGIPLIIAVITAIAGTLLFFYFRKRRYS